MMLNKVLCVVGLTVAVVAVADDSGFACSGFYAGLSGGVMQTAAEMAASQQVTFSNQYDTENQLSSVQHVDVWKDTGVGALYVGYRQRMSGSNVFMGAEVFANTAKRSITLNNFAYHQEPNDDEDFESLTTTTQAKLDDDEFGVDLQPGYLFDSHTLLYGRVGAAFNKLALMSNNNFSFTSTNIAAGTYNSPLSTSKTKDVTALRLGVGIEHAIGDNWSMTADYIYTDYGKVNRDGVADANGVQDSVILGSINSSSILHQQLLPGGSPYTTAGGLVGHASAHLATQALMVGLKYTFPAI